MFLHLCLFVASSLFFTPEMIERHLSTYNEAEQQALHQDLDVVRSVCFTNVAPPTDRAPVYLATAGGPGARKTTILERFLDDHPEYAQAVYLDPDPRTLRYMVHTYYAQSLNPLRIAAAPDYSTLLMQAYEKWRWGSNYIVLTLLEEAFAQRLDIAYGTTSTGVHIGSFFEKLKAEGYSIKLLLCSCPDAMRKEAITYRNETVRFYQSSPEDAIAKGKFFAERMPLYFQYADELYLYWSDALFENETLAAVVSGRALQIVDRDALAQFRAKYEEDRALGGHVLPSFDELLNRAVVDKKTGLF